MPEVAMRILALVSISESYTELRAEMKKQPQQTDRKKPRTPQVHPQLCVLAAKLSLYLSFALQDCFHISTENIC